MCMICNGCISISIYINLYHPFKDILAIIGHEIMVLGCKDTLYPIFRLMPWPLEEFAEKVSPQVVFKRRRETRASRIFSHERRFFILNQQL